MLTKLKKAALIAATIFTAGLGAGAFIYHNLAVTLNPPKNPVTETYIIKQGDTIWHIAETYRKLDCREPYILEYKDELMKLNPNLDVGKLQVGDKINIRYFVRYEN